MRIANFVPVDNNATGAEFYTSEGDTPGNIVFNIVVNVQLRQSQSTVYYKLMTINTSWSRNTLCFVIVYVTILW